MQQKKVIDQRDELELELMLCYANVKSDDSPAKTQTKLHFSLVLVKEWVQ